MALLLTYSIPYKQFCHDGNEGGIEPRPTMLEGFESLVMTDAQKDTKQVNNASFWLFVGAVQLSRTTSRGIHTNCATQYCVNRNYDMLRAKYDKSIQDVKKRKMCKEDVKN